MYAVISRLTGHVYKLAIYVCVLHGAWECKDGVGGET
jgi:hypothetical protein